MEYMEMEALNKLTYGLFIVSANQNGKDNACIINTVEQVTAEPNRILIAINKNNYTHNMIYNTGKFCISALSEEADFEIIKRFGFQSGKEVDKFQGFNECQRDCNELYYLTKGTNAYYSVNVEQIVDLGTHTLFIGSVKSMKVLNDIPSATYSFYHNHIKKQSAQKLQIDDLKSKKADGQSVWRCKICDYEYVGEELPTDYICPICKHPSSDFEKIS